MVFPFLYLLRPDFSYSLSPMSFCGNRRCIKKISNNKVCHSKHTSGTFFDLLNFAFNPLYGIFPNEKMESIFKFLLGNISFKVEIIRSDEILDGQLTMREVSRIYGLYAKVLTNKETFKVLYSV